MTITEEQAERAKAIVLDCLNVHNHNQAPFHQVWTKATQDFDGVPFLDVLVTYDGGPRNLDAAALNSFDTYLLKALREAGIHAIPSVSYIPQSEADQLDTLWIG